MDIGQIRQGDVLLDPAAVAMPEGVQPKSEVILALGELTGHAHRLASACVYEWEANGQRYVRVEGKEPGTLTHEDHDPIPAAVVASGVTYRVVPQRQWDLQGQWQKVTD